MNKEGYLKTQLEQLSALEGKQNEGRGVTCVRSVLHYMERKDPSTARYIATQEHDKIRQYPEIVQLLKEIFGSTCVSCQNLHLDWNITQRFCTDCRDKGHHLR